jgi:hypothetical protein
MYVRWSFPFLEWIVDADSWNRGDDPWIAEGWLEEGGRQLPFIILALPCSQQHTCMSGTVLLWTLSSGMIFSLQFHPNSFLSKRTASKFMLLMQVKNEWLHNAGAGVIAHVADSIKQQESRPCLPANL